MDQKFMHADVMYITTLQRIGPGMIRATEVRPAGGPYTEWLRVPGDCPLAAAQRFAAGERGHKVPLGNGGAVQIR